jgi:hypothetical protein
MMKYLISAGVVAFGALAAGPALATTMVTQWLCSADHKIAGLMVLGVDSYAFLGTRTEIVTPVEYDRDGQVDLRGTLSERVTPGGVVIVLDGGPLVTKYGLTSGYLNANSTRPSLVFGDGGSDILQCQPD